MITWVLRLLERSRLAPIHKFCLDFSTAMLANILHSEYTLDYLEKRNPKLVKEIITILHSLLKEKIPTSVLMHILISLSYLSKERFSIAMEETQFNDKISDFVEFYSQLNVTGPDHNEIDKKTILDLCAHMFHPKDKGAGGDMNTTLDFNEMKQEERIREFEKA
jgi:hypothetical protein